MNSRNYARTYQIAMSTQDESCLLTLPTEIRTPILMYVVTNTMAIPINHESDDEPQQVHLAILRVCQLLYHEGLSLFMEHNVPRVSITLVQREAWVMDWCNNRNGPIKDIIYHEFLRDIIPKFRRIRFEMSVSPDNRAAMEIIRGVSYHGMAWLQKCDLREKDVTLAFEPCILEYLRERQLEYSLIESLRGIRCKKVYLIGFDGQDAINMIHMMEGRLNMSEMKASCKETIDHFYRCRHVVDGLEDPRGTRWELESSLREALKRGDPVAFEGARSLILDSCDMLLEELRRRHEQLKLKATQPMLIE